MQNIVLFLLYQNNTAMNHLSFIKLTVTPEGNLQFVNQFNFNQVITLAHVAPEVFQITFGENAMPVRLNFKTLPLALEHIDHEIERDCYTWEQDQNELNDIHQ